MNEKLEIALDSRERSLVTGGPLSGLPALLEGEREVFLVYDRNVEKVAEGIMEACPGIVGMMPVVATEEEKSIETVLDICGRMMDADLSRDALVLALGGGVTTDLTGFAASVYKRGVRYANIPTTLLSQVDAGIGGKTGVNFESYKNMLGVIRQPVFTYLSSEVLETLPEREFRSGAAELLKTFLIEDRDGGYEKAVRYLSGGDGDLQPLLFAAASVKAGIVSRDPFENGERRKLNLGHTFAHAIEHEARLRGDDITHGEAVAIGIVLAAALADGLGLSRDLAPRLSQDFSSAGLPVRCPYPLSALAEAMGKDKKAASGMVRFVLPERIGSVIVRPLAVSAALKVLSTSPLTASLCPEADKGESGSAR